MLRADPSGLQPDSLYSRSALGALRLTFSEAKFLSSSMSLTAASWDAPLSCSRRPSAFSNVAICTQTHVRGDACTYRRDLFILAPTGNSLFRACMLSAGRYLRTLSTMYCNIPIKTHKQSHTQSLHAYSVLRQGQVRQGSLTPESKVSAVQRPQVAFPQRTRASRQPLPMETEIWSQLGKEVARFLPLGRETCPH